MGLVVDMAQISRETFFGLVKEQVSNEALADRLYQCMMIRV